LFDDVYGTTSNFFLIKITSKRNTQCLSFSLFFLFLDAVVVVVIMEEIAYFGCCVTPNVRREERRKNG
jgi:hypothetical protein